LVFCLREASAPISRGQASEQLAFAKPAVVTDAADNLRYYDAVLGGLAEFERDLIRTRTGEGRQRA